MKTEKETLLRLMKIISSTRVGSRGFLTYCVRHDKDVAYFLLNNGFAEANPEETKKALFLVIEGDDDSNMVSKFLNTGMITSKVDCQTLSRYLNSDKIHPCIRGELFRFLVKENYLNEKGESFLIRAILEGSSASVERLLFMGVNTEVIDNAGKTALNHAVETAQPKIVKLLLEASQ